jgi:hypothetical protein
MIAPFFATHSRKDVGKKYRRGAKEDGFRGVFSKTKLSQWESFVFEKQPFFSPQILAREAFL